MSEERFAYLANGISSNENYSVALIVMKAYENQNREAKIKPLRDLCVRKLDVHWWHLSSALSNETFRRRHPSLHTSRKRKFYYSLRSC